MSIKVTQVRSLIGRKKEHRLCIKGLGLRKVGDIRILEDTPAIRGMIKKAEFLLKVEEEKE
tara:strand:+ start:566 stop:748 length:183 start_codon:yes stop_codon:yes gene_type:complete